MPYIWTQVTYMTSAQADIAHLNLHNQAASAYRLGSLPEPWMLQEST